MLNIGLPALLEGEFFSSRDSLIYDSSKVNRLLVKYGSGSVRNKGNFPLTTKQWTDVVNYLQQISNEKTRLKIPILYGIDAVHGANYTVGSTMFPHQINIAATFQNKFAEIVGLSENDTVMDKKDYFEL